MLVPQISSDHWGSNSRQTFFWHFWFLWLIYLKWPEVSEHSQYMAVFCYFLFTATEHTLRSHPPLKRKQGKTTDKPPRHHLSILMCHSWPQHMDRNLPQRTTTKDVTGGRQQARDFVSPWTWRHKEKGLGHSAVHRLCYTFHTSSRPLTSLTPTISHICNIYYR